MTTTNCSTYSDIITCNSASSNNCYWYNYGSIDGIGGICIDKTQIIPISSYVFQAYQRKNVEGKYIDIYIDKYKNSKYASITNEPIVKSINITLTYNNGKSARSTITIPTGYISASEYTTITNPNITPPNKLRTTSTTSSTPTQYFTFSIPSSNDETSYNKSSIPTYFKLDISSITSDDDIEKIKVKNIQYTDINDNRSILISVKDLNEDELYMQNMQNLITTKVNSANGLLNENKNLINYIQNKTGYKLTFT